MPIALDRPQTTLNDSLNVGFLHAPLESLGPGRRVGLWLRGCALRCAGCLSEDLWEFDSTCWRIVDEVFQAVMTLYHQSNASGLTISGGEPIDQAAALHKLLQLCQNDGLRDILIYSGYKVESIVENAPWLPHFTAAIIDGPFDSQCPSRDIWRGSEGQSLIIFNEELRPNYETWINQTHRRVQLIDDGQQLRMLGIPYSKDIEPLKHVLGEDRYDQNKKM